MHNESLGPIYLGILCEVKDRVKVDVHVILLQA